MNICLHPTTAGDTVLMVETVNYQQAHWVCGYLISEGVGFQYYGAVRTIHVDGAGRELMLAVIAAAEARGFEVSCSQLQDA